MAIESTLRRNACSDGADTVSTPAAPAAGGSTGGADSSTACALLPPSPNELTPPSALAGNGSGLSTSRSPWASSRKPGFAVSPNNVGGSTPRCSARHALMNAAMPALPSVWPMFPLTEPSRHGSPRRVLWMSPSALASIMSPRTVPVPCASTKPICPASTSARLSARRISSTWDRRFGAVIPLLRPSWFATELFTTA